MRFLIVFLLAGFAGYATHNYVATSETDLAVLFDLSATPTPTDAHYQALTQLARSGLPPGSPGMGAFEKDYERAVAFENAKRQAQVDANRKRNGPDEATAEPDVVLNYEDVFGTNRTVDVTGGASDQ
jgi:hypothetical protein